MVLDKEKIYLGLYDSIVTKKSIVGFCEYHKKYITKNHLKMKSCIKKNCTHLTKYEDSSYWKNKEAKKIEKKKKKILEKQWIEKIYKIQNQK